MNSLIRTIYLVSLVAIFGSHLAYAANDPENEDEAGRPELIELQRALKEHYVFPDQVAGIMNHLQEAEESKRYRDISDAEFARLLTDDLIAATEDLHFVVGVVEQGPTPDAEFNELRDPKANYGFDTVQLLAGNIGYLRFDNFSEPDAAFATAKSALKLLENVDGLIIDLRYNNGGYNDLGQFIASHLFSNERDQLLSSYYYNENGTRIERGQWVLSGVPGRRRPDMPVHVLTSSVTFSAAEWMAFSLQQTGRATIVGAQTSGGGHPVERFDLGERFFVQIPIGEIRGPNGGEFEGVGVAPDIAVPSYRALAVSHMRLIEDLNTRAPSAAREWALLEARAAVDGVDVSADWLEKASGRYSGRELIHTDEGLSYRWRDRFTLRLTPLSDRVFKVEGTDDYRIELLGEGDDIDRMARVFQDGTTQVYERTP